METRKNRGIVLAAGLVASRRTVAAAVDFIDLVRLEVALEKELEPVPNQAGN